MNEPHSNSVDRRVFLQAGVVATAVTTGLVAGDAAAQESKGSTHKPVLPKRKLGKTGVGSHTLEPRNRGRTRRA